MSSSREGIVRVLVGYGLLIRQLGCQVMASTDLICPVNSTDVQSCWLFFSPDTYTQRPCPCAMVSRRAHSPAVGSAVPWRGFCSFDQDAVAKSNTARD